MPNRVPERCLRQPAGRSRGPRQQQGLGPRTTARLRGPAGRSSATGSRSRPTSRRSPPGRRRQS